MSIFHQTQWLINTNSNIYILYILNPADEGQRDWHTLQLQLKSSNMLNVSLLKTIASQFHNNRTWDVKVPHFSVFLMYKSITFDFYMVQKQFNIFASKEAGKFKV